MMYIPVIAICCYFGSVGTGLSVLWVGGVCANFFGECLVCVCLFCVCVCGGLCVVCCVCVWCVCGVWCVCSDGVVWCVCLFLCKCVVCMSDV